MHQKSEAAWNEILKNRPSKVTAFDEYKDFCKSWHGRDITLDQIKSDWATTMNRQLIKEFQEKADIKNLEYQKNVENWLEYYGVEQEQVDEYIKVMNRKKAKEQQERKRNLAPQKQEQQSNEEKPQDQKQTQNILRKVKKENKQPNQKSISPDDSTNEIIHQQPILVRKKNVQLEKEIPIHKQRSQKEVRFEQVKEDFPFLSMKSDHKPRRIID